jgi:hypothetical protein
VLLVASVAVVAGCGGSGVPTSTVVDSLGTQLVTHTGPARWLDWSLDTVRTLGGAETGPGAFFRVRQSLVDVDREGRIHVLDVSRFQALVFDSAGNHLYTVGGEGDGPDELRFPVSIASAADEGLYVLDGGKYSLLGWAGPDSASPRIPYPNSVINTRLAHFQLTPSGPVMWTSGRFGGSEQDGARRDRFVWIVGSDTIDLMRPAERAVSTEHYPECGMTYTVRTPLAPFPRWAQWEDRVVYNRWSEYRVDVADRGRTTLSIRGWDASPELSLPQAVEAVERNGSRGGPCNTTVREFVERHGFHPRIQLVRNVAVEASGRIWVEVQDAVGDRRLDLYSGSGDYEGSVADDFPMPIGFLPDGRALIQVVDDLDVEKIGIGLVLKERGGGTF